MGHDGTTDRAHGAAAWRDSAIIVAATLLPALTYVWGLGRYLDDSVFLRVMQASPQQDLASLYRALVSMPMVAVRPVQAAWLVGTYKLLGGPVLAVHLINQALFAAAGLLIHRVLCGLAHVRRWAFAIVMLLVCTPAYSSARYWWANHQSGVSLLLAAVAVWSMARAMRAASMTRRGLWLAGAMVAAAAAMLAYELVAVQLLLAPALLALADKGSLAAAARDRFAAMATLAIVGALGAAMVAKAGIGYGFAGPTDAFAFLSDTAWLYLRAGYTVFWTHGVFIPRTALGIAGGPWFAPLALLPAALIGAALLWRGRKGAAATCAGRNDRATGPALALIAAGLALFALGYAPFLSNFYYGGSPYGIANRGNVGGALGFALAGAGMLGLLGERWPRWGRVLLATYCAMGLFVQASIGQIWAQASGEAQRIVAQVMADAGPLQPGSVYLLYGHCQYRGPAPVLGSGEALWGELEMASGTPIAGADIIAPGSFAAEGGLVVQDKEFIGSLAPQATYPYGHIVIVNLADGNTHPIATREEAVRFFASHPADGARPCTFKGSAGTPLF